MKAKIFVNLIRKVVREEIDYALRREIKTLKEDLRDELKPSIVEHTERLVEVPEATKPSLRDQIMGNKPVKHKKKSTQNFTQDSSLNDLLNETARGDTNMESSNTPVSLSSPFGSGAPLPTDTTGMPPELSEALTRDYSGLMKSILKKK